MIYDFNAVKKTKLNTGYVYEFGNIHEFEILANIVVINIHAEYRNYIQESMGTYGKNRNMIQMTSGRDILKLFDEENQDLIIRFVGTYKMMVTVYNRQLPLGSHIPILEPLDYDDFINLNSYYHNLHRLICYMRVEQATQPVCKIYCN